MLKTVVMLNTFVDSKTHYFQDSLTRNLNKKRNMYFIYIIGLIVFTVTYDPLNAFLQKKY